MVMSDEDVAACVRSQQGTGVLATSKSWLLHTKGEHVDGSRKRDCSWAAVIVKPRGLAPRSGNGLANRKRLLT
jgi:hypothetical protein